MYYCEVSSPLTAYVFDGDAGNKLVGIFSAYDAKKVINLLNAERNAHAQPKPEGLSDVCKEVGRDIARRYLARFGGRTFRVPTAHDDFEIYLVNRENEAIATISIFDRFPKPVDESTLTDIPF